MRLEHLLFILALVTFGIVAVMNFCPEPRNMQFTDDIETIRIAQRECLGRPVPHAFTLIETTRGYWVACKALD